MAKAVYTGLHLSLVLSLFLLLSCLGSSKAADTHSLSCNSTVKVRTTLQQPWYEGQCSLDGEPFLQFDDNKFIPLGDLGKAVHATQVWTETVQELDISGKELRKKLADTNLGTIKISVHCTLQIILLSQLEQEQIVGASLQFNISGKYRWNHQWNMSRTLISLEALGITNKWKNDEALTTNLKTFTGCLSSCLEKLIKLPWERTRSTSRAPDITQLPSATQLPPTINTTQLPPTTKFPHKEVFISLGLISIIIAFVICIWRCVKRKSQGVSLQMPMNCCSINCYKPQRKERPMEPSEEFPNHASKMLSQEDELQDMKVRIYTKPDISITPSKSQETSHRGGEGCERTLLSSRDMAVELLNSQQL